MLKDSELLVVNLRTTSAQRTPFSMKIVPLKVRPQQDWDLIGFCKDHQGPLLLAFRCFLDRISQQAKYLAAGYLDFHSPGVKGFSSSDWSADGHAPP